MITARCSVASSVGGAHGLLVAGDTRGEYGKWETAYRRYELWLKQGLWERILEALGEEGLPGPTTKES